jgi:hypothetical protein
VANCSKETTAKEYVSIAGFTDNEILMNGINLAGGQTNAIEWCTTMLKMPTLIEALGMFEDEMRTVNV